MKLIQKDLYVLVKWPDSQLLMDKSWFNQCILALGSEETTGSSAYFVPCKLYKTL